MTYTATTTTASTAATSPTSSSAVPPVADCAASSCPNRTPTSPTPGSLPSSPRVSAFATVIACPAMNRLVFAATSPSTRRGAISLTV